MGDNAVPKGGGVSVLAGWLGDPGQGVFSVQSVLSQVGQSWAKLLSDTEKSFL